MDYLERAKKALEFGADMSMGELAIANALIALVEEHRKANELHSLFEEAMNKDE